MKAETDSRVVARMFCGLLLPCKMRGYDIAISYIYFATMEAIAIYTDKCCVFRIGGGQGQPREEPVLSENWACQSIRSAAGRGVALAHYISGDRKSMLYTRLFTAGVKFVVGDNFQSQPCKRILRHVAEKQRDGQFQQDAGPSV
jgi:hypothetical protein